jgi:peroxiredoxin
LPVLLLLLGLLPATTRAADPAVETDLVDRPAPEFSLTLLDGTEVDQDTYDGYILVLYFLPRDDVTGRLLGGEIEFFQGRGRGEEIRYLAITTMPEEEVRSLWAEEGWTHPVALDRGGEVTRRFLGSPRLACIVVDFRGTVRVLEDSFDSTFQSKLRSTLRGLLLDLGREMASVPVPDLRWREPVPAPVFEGKDLEGEERTSAAFRGKPLLVYFFEESCGECAESTSAVRDAFLGHREQGFQVVGVVTRTDADVARRYVRERGLSFPVLLDADGSIRARFGATSGDPDLYWIDADGNLRWRELGVPKGIRELTKLRTEVLLGTARPESFLPGTYVGFRVCRTCHEAAFQDWIRTPHAVAGQSIEGDRKEVCLPCHVTGLRRPGGYDPVRDPVNMFQVQCESCHGPGGGHVPGSTGDLPPWQARCLTCHKGPYELEQPFEQSFRWMQHGRSPDAATLFAYLPERREDSEGFIAAREHVTGFHPGTRYVGPTACKECHASIHAAWKEGPHAAALESLLAEGSTPKPECVGCHVTGAGSLTGYRGRSTPDLAGVGCESCHGPGGDHVDAPGPLRRASIYGLAPDCPTCRVEAVCRACHDLVNDPDFRMPEGPVHGAPGE